MAYNPPPYAANDMNPPPGAYSPQPTPPYPQPAGYPPPGAPEPHYQSLQTPGPYPPQGAPQPYYPPPQAPGPYPPQAYAAPVAPVGQAPVQQQQQSVVVVNNAQPTVVTHTYYQSYVGHIVFACFVTWCCGLLFGFIAFILAVVAESTSSSDPQGARKLGCASIGMSIAGIIVPIIVVVVVVVVIVSVGASAVADAASSSPTSCSGYYRNGECYRRVASYYTKYECENYKSDSYYSLSDRKCYYN